MADSDVFVQQVEAMRRQLSDRFQSRERSSAVGMQFDTYEMLCTAAEELQVAEEELRVQSEALLHCLAIAEMEGRHYQDLFESASDGYLITDRLGNIRAINAAAVTLLERLCPQLIGASFVLLLSESARRTFRLELKRLEQDPQTQPWRGYVQLPGGVVLEVFLQGRPLLGPLGQVNSLHAPPGLPYPGAAQGEALACR